MNQPIGRCIGNALEIEESIEVLRGEGPADTWELTQALAVRMLRLARLAMTMRRWRRSKRWSTRGALARFGEMIAAQGGDSRHIDDPSKLPQAPHREEVTAGVAGQLKQFGRCAGGGTQEARRGRWPRAGGSGRRPGGGCRVARRAWADAHRGLGHRSIALAHAVEMRRSRYLRSALEFDGECRLERGVRAQIS